MLAVDIYGSLIHVPDVKDGVFVEDWGTNNIKEQYWRRKELPDIFDDVALDDDGNAILTEEQEELSQRRGLGSK